MYTVSECPSNNSSYQFFFSFLHTFFALKKNHFPSYSWEPKIVEIQERKQASLRHFVQKALIFGYVFLYFDFPEQSVDLINPTFPLLLCPKTTEAKYIVTYLNIISLYFHGQFFFTQFINL